MSMKRRILTALTALTLLATSAALPARAETLADTLVAAYRNSNLLDQNRALLRATDEDVVQARAALLPVLNFVTSATRNSAQARLVAEMTLIDFGRGRLGVAATREQVLALRAALIGIEQAVLFRAVAAYVDIQTAAQVIGLRQSNVRLIEQELRAARERFELGDSTRTDVAIAEARLAAARSALSAAEGDLAVAREEFRLAVGRYPGALSAMPRLPQLPASLDTAVATARVRYPAITQAQHQVRAAELGGEIARTQRYGTVSGEISADVTHAPQPGLPGRRTNSDLNAGVRWNVPLYQGGRLASGERQAIARTEGQRASLHQTVAETQQAVASNWSRLAVARARLSASDQQIEAARAAFDAVRAEAELGARTTLDVLNAEQELLDAQFARIEAAAALQLASYSLLESTGQLTVQTLNLGIPTYDVEAYSSAFGGASRARTPSVQGQRLDAILNRYGN
ncbi:TolC family protein [Pararhodobacter sp. SW119]|uniref:TolC family protein n=1 Tax=Pararhodobacter sp. SW119 TaxID=2780075 RepID=UPI001AE0907F|nr:TolC family protein [Pararhodobacter sp. SW119]